nr:transposase [Klebsiella pneumoniae]
MTGILLGQEARKRKTPQEKIAIIQQTMEPGMNVSHVARLHGIQPAGRGRKRPGAGSAGSPAHRLPPGCADGCRWRMKRGGSRES